MDHDYDRLRLEEMADISAFLATLDDDQFDTPSLCDGWRVRDVISHMIVGYTTPLPTMVTKVARYRFKMPEASKKESIAYGSSHSPDEIRREYQRIHRDNVRKGISKFIKPMEGEVDHVIHHQDIRRPLGMPRQVPEARLTAALDGAVRISGFIGSKKRAAGVRLVATDIDWSSGDGPEVRGTGEALLLAMGGRKVVLPELDGEGVPRVSAAA